MKLSLQRPALHFPLVLLLATAPLACGDASSRGGGSVGPGGPGDDLADGGAGDDDGAPGQTDTDGGLAWDVDGGTSGSYDGATSAPPPGSGCASLPGTVANFVDGVAVSTIAGSDAPGTQDGTGAAAQFDNPTGMALDSNGNLLVTDYDSGRVRLVTPAGVVTTLAAAKNFVDPFNAVVTTDGHYYVETDSNASGEKSTLTGTIWLVTPLGGGAIAAPTVVAQNFGRPRAMAAAPGGSIFVADRTVEVADSLVMSNGTSAFVAGASGIAGYVDGIGSAARFNAPIGAATLPDGSFLVTDSGNNVIRRVTADGEVSTFAGDGVPGLVDGPCAAARFSAARGVAVDAAGNVYVSDIGNHVIRRIRAGCVVETIAGDCTLGFNDGDGTAAKFYGQEGITVTPDGKTIYLADGNGGDGLAYHRIRAIAVP